MPFRLAAQVDDQEAAVVAAELDVPTADGDVVKENVAARMSRVTTG